MADNGPPSTPKPPDVLHHYTTASGLLGIMESSSLFASDVRFMNDESEITFGVERALTALDEGEIALPTDGAKVQLREGLENVHRWYRSFAVCFCDQGDLLSQWRGYGADGGFSVGFRSAELAGLEVSGRYSVMHDETEGSYVVFERQNMSVALAPVTYPQEADRGLPLYFDFDSDDVKAAAAGLVHTFAFTKDPAFGEEHEWRLLWTTFREDASQRVQHRTSERGLVPYLPVVFEKTAVAAVTVGPGLHQEMRADAVRSLLEANDLRDTTVRLSEIPLR